MQGKYKLYLRIDDTTTNFVMTLVRKIDIAIDGLLQIWWQNPPYHYIEWPGKGRIIPRGVQEGYGSHAPRPVAYCREDHF